MTYDERLMLSDKDFSNLRLMCNPIRVSFSSQ